MADAVRIISVVGKIEAAISLGGALGNYILRQEAVERICADADINVLPVYPDLFIEV